MSSQQCIICKEGSEPKKTLVTNKAMVDELLSCCHLRYSYGQADVKPLLDRLAALSDQERENVPYHSECRKRLTNKYNIDYLAKKREPALEGHLSMSRPVDRPKRTKIAPKAEVCMFSICNFCTTEKTEPLHRVLTDSMGEKPLEIKQKTSDNHVRTCLTELKDPGDASALEKYYHRNCLRAAQRTMSLQQHDQEKMLKLVCDELVIRSVQNTLIDANCTLTMADRCTRCIRAPPKKVLY